jgi:hypothetical protein
MAFTVILCRLSSALAVEYSRNRRRFRGCYARNPCWGSLHGDVPGSEIGAVRFHDPDHVEVHLPLLANIRRAKQSEIGEIVSGGTRNEETATKKVHTSPPSRSTEMPCATLIPLSPIGRLCTVPPCKSHRVRFRGPRNHVHRAILRRQPRK